MRRGEREQASSTLLLDERFASGDPRFLDELLAATAGKKLKSFAAIWYRDARPFAREALLHYIDDGCDRPHHRPLVKSLFKLAEAAGDDEAMEHFLVAFDRLARRVLVTLQRYDWRSRESTTEVVLRSALSIPVSLARAGAEGRYTLRTRMYLVRRAFRYFRTIGRKDLGRYGTSVRRALALYRDEHLAKPEHLLDAWGLVHILFRHSATVDRRARGIVLASGARLASLEPSPMYPQAWSSCFDGILKLAEDASSRTVRTFSIAILRRDYDDDLRALPLLQLMRLLRSPHDEIQTLAAELFETVSGLESLPIGGWLEMLEVENPLAIPLICRMVEKHVTPDRLTLAQCVLLARARPAPVAELGLRWTKAKGIESAPDLRVALGLASAEAPLVRVDAMDWLIGIIGASAFVTPDDVRDLIDSTHTDVRHKAIALMRSDARFTDETTLWAALSESPYGDTRDELVRNLGERSKMLAPRSLKHVWASSLLAIHRGGRAKRVVVGQIAQRIASAPADANELLPLLRIALRSVRPGERRQALGALVRAACERPELRDTIARQLPELALLDMEVA